MKLGTGIRLGAGAVATAFLLAGCADPAATTHAVHLTHDGSETFEVSMQVGQHLSIVDDGFNASVGDGWTVVGPPDPAILRYDGEDVVLNNPGADGSGGTYSFDYTAIGAGTTTVTVEYAYRGDAQFESTVRVTVD
ncbi:MAG TPA: protease inhibitor I42 family protein [Microbacteriaceae bacterium]|nr:protease inhibitor I42 family protein [Microbacteriaceae bacterium]